MTYYEKGRIHAWMAFIVGCVASLLTVIWFSWKIAIVIFLYIWAKESNKEAKNANRHRRDKQV